MAYLTPAELRTAVPLLSPADKFSDDSLEQLVSEFEGIAEGYRGVAFQPRAAIDSVLIDDSSAWLRLAWPKVRSISALTITDPAIGGTATSVLATDYTFDPDSGDVHYPGIFPAGALVVVSYTHGLNFRTVTDAVTVSGDATVTSATAAFTDADVGQLVEGAGVPAGARIASRNSATSIELSANATASATTVSLRIAPLNGLLRACKEYVRTCALADRSGVPRDVIAQGDGNGGYTRYSTPDWDAGRPTGYLEIDRILNGLEDHRRIL